MIKQLLLLSFLLLAISVQAEREVGDYKVNPGDVLEVFVWNEEALTKQAVVRPDGFFSLPLAGEIRAGGKTADAIRVDVEQALGKYLKDAPVVTVSIFQLNGNICTFWAR